MTIDDEQFNQLLQQMTALNSKVEELAEQNRDLRILLNETIATLPIILRDELQAFITQFNESLNNKDSSETANAIRELTGVLKDLKARLNHSELIHADMTAQVKTAVDELRAVSQKLRSQDNGALEDID